MADMTSRSSSRRPASRPAAFTVHPTPIGQTLVVATDEGLAALQLLEVHVDARDHALAALTMITAVVPGTVWSELAPDRSALLIHVFDLDDEAAFIRHYKTDYEQPLKEIFE